MRLSSEYKCRKSWRRYSSPFLFRLALMTSSASLPVLQLQLEVELLKEDKKNADVTHASYLGEEHWWVSDRNFIEELLPSSSAARLQALQTFCTHLQDVLKDHKLLAQRLTRPLSGTGLPIPAHLHRYASDVPMR